MVTLFGPGLYMRHISLKGPPMRLPMFDNLSLPGGRFSLDQAGAIKNTHKNVELACSNILLEGEDPNTTGLP